MDVICAFSLTESINTEESTADDTDIQTPLTPNDNIYTLIKHSNKAFMNLEAKIEKRESKSSNVEILQENIHFLQKMFLANRTN